MPDSSLSSMSMPPPQPRKVVRMVVPSNDSDDEEMAAPTDYQSHIASLQRPASNEAEMSGPQPHPHPPSATSNNSSSLTHLQSHWPGSTNNGQHLEVRPMSFHELLQSEDYQIVIPLFQRRYCWTTVQIQQWYQDVISGGQHSTHKTMFKKHVEQEDETEEDDGNPKSKLICIDGQQRTTTVTLFLMALRAQARKHDCETLVKKIDALLFQNQDALAGLQRWAKYQAFRMTRAKSNNDNIYKIAELEVGWLPPFPTMLVPSYIDRAAYFEILCHDYILEALEQQTKKEIVLEFNSSCKESVQYQAFDIFSTELARTTLTPSLLNKLFRTQMDHFSIMYIELLSNTDNLQQIFLWMQEKSIFGMGRLLYNPHPGIDFTPIDLARNLVVSAAMNQKLAAQMDFYLQCWVIPLEKRFQNNTNLSRILYHWVNRIDQEQETTAMDCDTEDDTDRYVGDMETKLQWYKESVPPALQSAFGKDAPMMVYARFHSIVQQRALLLCGDPNAITEKVANSIVQDMVQEGERMGL